MFGLNRNVRWLSLIVLLLDASQLRLVRAQGTCVCQPAQITFTLDFSLACDDSNVLTGDPGIEDAFCSVFPMNDDQTPVSVSSIGIVEVDTNFDVIKMVNYTDTYSTGDNITYVGYVVSNASSVESGTIPYSLQVTIVGENAVGDIITNSYAIVYTNDCTIYPVLDIGSQIGWTAVTELVGPPVEFCPAASESIVPSSVPSLAPVTADTCICQPNQISFVLDFALTCDDRTILTGDPGIKEAECLIFPDGVDPIPVSVESVHIFETDQDLNLINQLNINETLSSGGTIVYNSFASINSPEEIIPTGITVQLNGINANGESITNSFVILYTNECDVYPVLTNGDQIGWTKLEMLVPPSSDFCPNVHLETLAPSASIIPSDVPSGSPVMSIVPSDVPSDPFTMGPTDPMLETESPVSAPVGTPVDVPVEPPVDVPVEPPVDVPVKPPVDAPVEPPKKGMKKEGMMMMMEGMKKDMSKDNMSMDKISNKGMMMGGKGMSDDSSSKGKGKSKDSSKGKTEDDDSTKGKGMSKDGHSKGKGSVDDSTKGKGMSKGKTDMGKGGKGKDEGKREKEEAEKKDKLHVKMGERRQLRYSTD